MESEAGGDQEIVKRWKELLSKQPDALINSARSPTPISPYICFCLSKQHSIRAKLCRENPDVTVSVIFFLCTFLNAVPHSVLSRFSVFNVSFFWKIHYPAVDWSFQVHSSNMGLIKSARESTLRRNGSCTCAAECKHYWRKHLYNKK